MPVQTKSRSEAQVEKVRKEFPMLGKKINRKPIIYFDNAATGQKPQVMIERLQEFYMNEYGKPRENHELGKETTSNVEEARRKVAKFIGCNNEKNIIFTRGCTESINIVAGSFAKGVLKKGDEILITALEHHANIIPWQFACEQTGASLKVIPVTPSGQVVMDTYKEMLSKKVKILSISHSSHVLG